MQRDSANLTGLLALSGALHLSMGLTVNLRKGLRHFVTARTFAGNQVYTRSSTLPRTLNGGYGDRQY
jgi:hypothetical protein